MIETQDRLICPGETLLLGGSPVPNLQGKTE